MAASGADSRQRADTLQQLRLLPGSRVDAPIRLVVVGAGSRGSVYASYALETDACVVTCVCEPLPGRRAQFAARHGLLPEQCYDDWRAVAERQDRLADVAIICTMDQQHVEPAVAFARVGYDILLEKPMATTEQGCRRIARAVKEAGVMMTVGHVMRYTPFTKRVREIIASGRLGKVMHVQHLEPVGHWHFAHSYVRGNWRRSDESSFSLLAKSCHDIDWLQYVLSDTVTAVSSFGHLGHFASRNKPAGAADRCLDCSVETSCPYSAKRVYLDQGVAAGKTWWPVDVLVPGAVPDIENITDALRHGPYGRCVYACDNDVNDQQSVMMQFAGGTQAVFSMVAFTQDLCVRKTRIFGTMGQLETADSRHITLDDFVTQEHVVIDTEQGCDVESAMSGHGYADFFLMQGFLRAVATRDTRYIAADAEEAMRSHLVVFAAEESCVKGGVPKVPATT